MENVQIPSSRPYINFYTCRLTEPTFRTEINTSEMFQFSHIIQNHWKKLPLLLDLQFQFNCGAYPIRQLSSLKLSIDSQCMQPTSSKSIYVANVRKWWYINKNVKMIFCVAIWIWMSSLTYWNLNSPSKILRLLGFMLVYCSQKMKWYTFPKSFV